MENMAFLLPFRDNSYNKWRRKELIYVTLLKRSPDCCKKPQRSVSMPGTESKPALQLPAVGSYLQWLEAAAPTTGNNILKSFELHRTETPQLQLQRGWGLRRRVKIGKEQGETFLSQYLLNVWIQSKKIPKHVYNLTVFIRCLKGNFHWAILLLPTATGKKPAPCCISFILLFQLQLQSMELELFKENYSAGEQLEINSLSLLEQMDGRCRSDLQ